MHQRSFKNIRGRISKKHSSCPDELHHRKTLRQNIPFYGHLSDTFVQLTIIFERICQKRNLKVEKNIFKQKLKKNIYSWKMSSSSFSETERNFFGISTETFSGVIKTAFYVSSKNSWYFPLNKFYFFYHFQTLSKNILDFDKILSACSWNLHSTCPEEAFAENKTNVFFRNKKFVIFLG